MRPSLPVRPAAIFAALLLASPPLIAQTKPVAAINTDVTLGLKRDPKIVAALRDISAANIRETDTFLAGLGSRHTMGDTLSSTRGPGAARRYPLRQTDAVLGGVRRMSPRPVPGRAGEDQRAS